MHELQFPVGHYSPIKNPSREQLDAWINTIASFPKELSILIENVSAEALNWRYRPNGWTVKQVIHHCADSHMNSIIRFKLALTEDEPTIRPYFEDRWAELPDSQDENLNDVILLLTGLHAKWTLLLRSIAPEDLRREFLHPEHGKKFNIAETIGSYAWHCEHHLAHVKNGLNSGGKYN